MRLALLLLLALPAIAQESRCTCRDGNASWLYLRAPKAAPDDPDPCPATYKGVHPRLPLPKAWNDACWQSPRMECFLRRHAVSWRITCSLCTAEKCCPFPNWEHCPECHGEKRPREDFELESLKYVLAEHRKIGGSNLEAAMSPHFLVFTDLPSLKIRSVRGQRLADQHELMHIYLQRAEQARAEWVAVFGEPMNVRSVMFLVKHASTRKDFAQATFGHAEQKLLYGGGGELVSGLAANGFALTARDDESLHFNCRHMIGHLCMSTYVSPGVHEDYLPQWIFRGSAHWLCKRHPRAKDHVFFCSYEGVEVSGSGAKWDDKARKIAARGPRRDPVEAMFQAATAKQMDFDMHVRAWSWFEIFTAEEPEPFVKLVRALREGKPARPSVKEAFGQAPEFVDERWRERAQGKRASVAATAAEHDREVELAAAGSRELRDIARETDLQLLAGRIRGLEKCRNVRTARLLVALVDSRDSDRVREVIALILARTDDPEVRAWLRGEGYERAGRLGRATLCRTFGAVKDAEAAPLLREALQDSFWLVRANAARALARLGDRESIPALARLAADSGKTAIAAMDALGAFGPEAEETIPLWSEAALGDKAWQVRVAACDAFRGIGSKKPVDALIERMRMEGGRVRDAISQALQDLTGVKKDWDADVWKEWWKKQRPDLEEESAKELGGKPKPPREDRYAKDKPPTYWGIQVFAKAVGYVLDTSLSMSQGFEISPEKAEQLGRRYKATTRMGICKEELEYSIRELDPRTRINLYLFNDRVRVWQDAPVSAGSMGENAIGIVRGVTPSGQTNYYDALRAAMAMPEGGDAWPAGFADTPDTLFFLTDGTPTDGDITKADELLAWFEERNRFARLRVHVIAFGTTDVDAEFLRAFAEGTGGTFLHLKGKY